MATKQKNPAVFAIAAFQAFLAGFPGLAQSLTGTPKTDDRFMMWLWGDENLEALVSTSIAQIYMEVNMLTIVVFSFGYWRI